MSRDTSADTTLDNANMGTREDFEKWAAEEGRSIKRSNPDYAPKPYASAATNNALDGWNARQPEIDALKDEIDQMRSGNHAMELENAQLEAENERLREELSKLKPHSCLHGILMNGTATKDFSTTTKEE